MKRRALRILLATAALAAGLACVSSAVAINWGGEESSPRPATVSTPAVRLSLGGTPLSTALGCGALSLPKGSLTAAYIKSSCGRHSR